MSTLIQSRDAVIPLKNACEALGLSRATWYRQRCPKVPSTVASRRPSPRRLSEMERARVLDVLHEPRFIDQPPPEVYAKLLGEGLYLCSIRTMHRLLADAGESGERRAVRPKTHHAVPRLSATAPNQVWSWDSVP
jgi:putative transposase